MGLEELLLDRAKREGKIEGEEKTQREIARNLKRMGMSVEDIIEATGLSVAEIEKL